ncbi:BnaA03g18260D [Brassica napus]|uniref:BnaA03g18260D protein n=1 Tax=Brassica napus TaxID=3708 RepID=A0A078EZZ1_BRANA|nr:BnaA03g18260D [Brassica napus]
MGIEGGNTSSKSGNVDKFLSPPPGFEGCSKSVKVEKLLSPPPGFEGVNRSSKSGNVDKFLSPPPGFEGSQARFVLRKVQEKTNGFRPGDADSFQKLVNSRPWIVHDHTTPSSGVLKPTKPEVHPRRLPRVSKKVVLEEAPVFNPTEKEYNDTLSYIASLRDISEPHGICCVVPPPSWDPPCLLGERKIWEGSRFFTQVQIFDGVQTEDPKIKKETDADSDDDDTFHKVKFCRTELGNEYTLETFKNFADSYLESHFRVKEKVLASMYSSPSVDAWPTVADVEKEFRKLLENPFVELGVLYGNNIDTKTFGSGFPLSGSSESCKYKTSGWNLNNTAKLPGSLLTFDDCESVCVPRLSVGMCLSSQLWKSEKERLYSLCYLHTGAPRVWYSVAGCHRYKFKAFMESFVPKVSGEQSKRSYDSVMAMSPYALHMEGIPVTRCVQNRGQYVILFPGTYYSAVDCGFNCLEIANFATLDWLPHKEIDALQNQEKKRKSLLSYDKVLFGAASEAVKCLKEYSLTKKETSGNMRWFNACGKEGMFSNTVKSRVKKEKSRVQYLSGPLKPQRMKESFDDVSKRACCVCFVDLHLSAVQCSCSADRYSCLSHMKNLCACPYDKKSFLYRYTIDELNILAEALEQRKLSCMFKWGNIDGNYCASPAIRSSQPGGDKGKTTDEVMQDVETGGKEQMKARGKVRSIIEIMNVKEENDNESGPVDPKPLF